jgi:hypothetical protein
MRRTGTLLVALLTALLASVGAARAATQTASSGTVAATLSYTLDREGLGARDVRLTVTRAGVLAYEAPMDPRPCRHADCRPVSTEPDSSSIAARDLDGDGEPEVITDVYTGGAHCCVVSRILRWDGLRYVRIDHDWGDPGYSIDDVDGDGRPELVSDDDRLAYLYGSYVSSARPVLVLALREGGLVDVTGDFPALVRSDRARLWHAAHGDYRGTPRGAYAAWAADRYRLGERAAALRTLRRLAARGVLRTDIGSNSLRAQRRWVRRLDRDLRRFGYPA